MLTESTDTQDQVRANEERMAELAGESGPLLADSARRTTHSLTRLAATVASHSWADTSIGILEDVVAQAPRLAAEVERLDRDHRELPTLLVQLRMRAKQLQDDIDTVLSRLAQHQYLAEHLVYEAFATDVGEGD